MARGRRAAVGCAALLLLACAAGAAAAEGKAPPQKAFVSWLTQQSSSKASTQYASEVPVETVCLSVQSERNCRCFGSATEGCLTEHLYIESLMGCCPVPSRDGVHMPDDDLLAESSPSTVCNWEEEFFDTSITYAGTSAQKVGLFRVTCTIREGGESCGFPLCNGMTIAGQGDILFYDNIAFTSQPATIPLTDCAGFDTRNSLRAARRANKKTARRADAPSNEASTAASGEEARTQYAYDDIAVIPGFYMYTGLIYSGNFWVTSRHRPTKFTSGQMQIVVPDSSTSSPADTPVLTPPARAYVASPDQLTLEFFKTH